MSAVGKANVKRWKAKYCHPRHFVWAGLLHFGSPRHAGKQCCPAGSSRSLQLVELPHPGRSRFLLIPPQRRYGALRTNAQPRVSIRPLHCHCQDRTLAAIAPRKAPRREAAVFHRGDPLLLLAKRSRGGRRSLTVLALFAAWFTEVAPLELRRLVVEVWGAVLVTTFVGNDVFDC